jgi:hypothetical protein
MVYCVLVKGKWTRARERNRTRKWDQFHTRTVWQLENVYIKASEGGGKKVMPVCVYPLVSGVLDQEMREAQLLTATQQGAMSFPLPPRLFNTCCLRAPY